MLLNKQTSLCYWLRKRRC